MRKTPYISLKIDLKYIYIYIFIAKYVRIHIKSIIKARHDWCLYILEGDLILVSSLVKRQRKVMKRKQNVKQKNIE